MIRFKRACAGLLAMFFVATALLTILLPATAYAEDPPDYWGNKNTSYGNNIKKVDPRTDRDEFYIQIDYTNRGTTDYMYKADSAKYYTNYQSRIVTFEASGGDTLTADICNPETIMIFRDSGDGVGKKPSRYYFDEFGDDEVTKSFVDAMKTYSRDHAGYFQANHLNVNCQGAQPIDLTPLPNRQIRATVDFNFDDSTTNRNAIQAEDQGITAQQLLDKLYICPYNLDSKRIVTTADKNTPACAKINGVEVNDILDDNDNTQVNLRWDSPDIMARNYGLVIVGIDPSRFNRPLDFGDTGDSTYKTYAVAEDSDIDFDFAAILAEARRNDSFVNGVAEYEEIPATLRETSLPSTNVEEESILECNRSANPLSWLICPLVSAANDTVQLLDNAIVSQLNVDEDDYFSKSKTGDSFYGVWSNFRYIGLVFLVVAALVMVIAQAFSFGPFDAYTVKKVLPRILVAVIFMSLSWDICKFLIALTNDIGLAVRVIIQAPFAGVDNAIINSGTSSVGALALTGLGLSLGLWGMLTFVGVAALSVIIAFVVLAVRKIAIVFLVLVAPFAIACSILPNTQKAYKLWWDTFSKALLMFPIVMGFIAVGRVFAKVASTNDGLISQLIVMVAYFGPYFALPYAFRLAGGAIATISGMVNDRGRGAFDRMRKFRQAQPARRWEKAKQGNLWRGNNAFTRKSSDLALGLTQLNKAGFNPKRWRSNMSSAMGLQTFDASSEGMEKNQTLRAMSGDDDKLWALTHAKNEQQVRSMLLERAPQRFTDTETLNQATAEILRVRRELGERVARVAAARLQAGSGTGYNYNENVEDDMLNTIIDVAGNDRTLAGRMLAEMRGKAKESGRIDLAGGGYAKQMIAMDRRRAAIANRMAGGDEMAPVVNEDGRYVYNDDGTVKMERFNTEDAREFILHDVLRSNAGGAVAYKVKAVEALAPVMKKDADKVLHAIPTDPSDYAKMNADAKQAAVEAAARELASLAGKWDVANQIAPQNAEALSKGVLTQTIDVKTLAPEMRELLDGAIRVRQVQRGPDGKEQVVEAMRDKITYQQAIDSLRTNPTFQSMSRQLGMNSIDPITLAQLQRGQQASIAGGAVDVTQLPGQQF